MIGRNEAERRLMAKHLTLSTAFHNVCFEKYPTIIPSFFMINIE